MEIIEAVWCWSFQWPGTDILLNLYDQDSENLTVIRCYICSLSEGPSLHLIYLNILVRSSKHMTYILLTWSALVTVLFPLVVMTQSSEHGYCKLSYNITCQGVSHLALLPLHKCSIYLYPSDTLDVAVTLWM